MVHSLKVGELLIRAGVISEAQLERALAEQHHWGRRLGVTLIKLGLVEENHLVRALAQQLGIPATSLVGRRIAPEVVALVPARVATQHHVVPLFVKQTREVGQLFLGMEDPSKHEVLDDLCFRTGLAIQPVMMGPTEIGDALDRYYGAQQEPRSASRPVPAADETTIGERSLGLSALDATPDSAAGGEVGSEALAGDSKVQAPADPSQELRAIAHETQKTRLVLKAITQLLVEQEVLDLDEIQSRIAQLKKGDPAS